VRSALMRAFHHPHTLILFFEVVGDSTVTVPRPARPHQCGAAKTPPVQPSSTAR